MPRPETGRRLHRSGQVKRRWFRRLVATTTMDMAGMKTPTVNGRGVLAEPRGADLHCPVSVEPANRGISFQQLCQIG